MHIVLIKAKTMLVHADLDFTDRTVKQTNGLALLLIHAKMVHTARTKVQITHALALLDSKEKIAK